MTTYISAAGLQDLKDELIQRTSVTRREIADKISCAMELGDLSENFEYHEAKEQQGLNEARVAQLEEMIRNNIIVKDSIGGDTIDLGTTFDVEVNQVIKTFCLVGSSEADPLSGKISNESPIGKSFIGRKVGEEVEISIPSGVINYKIISIK